MLNNDYIYSDQETALLMSVDTNTPRNRSRMPRNKIIFYALCIVATLALIAGVISVLVSGKVGVVYNRSDIIMEDEGRKWTIRDVDVTPGIYQIEIDYHSSVDVRAEVKVRDGSWRDLLTDDPTLHSFQTDRSFKVWAKSTCKKLYIEMTGDEAFEVNEVSVVTASNSNIYRISQMVFAYLFVVGILAAFLLFREIISANSRAIIGIAVITVISSVGLFVTYIFPGHDINFHLLRVDGLADALAAGNFPDRVQTNWCYDWGYSVSAMYGDTTLLIASVLRLLGFPLVTSYKVFIFAVNLGTAIISYKVFEKIGGSKSTAMVVAFLYTCAPYRLCCIYLRAAVGEFTAMTFLPLILLIIKYIYYEDTASADYGKKLLIPALSLSMIIQTHILTCVMLSIFVVLFAVIQFRKTFRMKTLIYIGKIILFTALISLWFIIPLLRFYHEPMELQNNMEWKYDFPYYGVTFSELFAQRAGSGTYFNFAFNTSLADRMPLMLGNGFLVLITAALFFVKKAKVTVTHIAVGVLAVLAVFMTTIYFPYNQIHSAFAGLGKFIGSVNIPYRYITISIVFLSIISLFAIRKIRESAGKTLVYILVGASVLVCFDQGMSVIYTAVYSGSAANYYDGANLDPNNLIGYEYLYDRRDLDVTTRDNIPNAENSVITAVYRNRNSFDITLNETANEAYVEAPVFAYPGYVATVRETGEKLNVVHGSNNRVRVDLQPGFSGTVEIRYKDLPIWNVAEVISVVALAYLILRPYLWQLITKNKKDSTSTV